MYWSFENFRSPDYVLISAGGNFTGKDFASMLDELYELDYWRPRIPLLLDESEMDILPIATDQLLNAADYFLDQNARLAYTKIAVVLGSPQAMRVAERFRQAVNSQTKAVVEAFLDKAEAEEWLLAG
jgi:hypothetical protein